MLCQDVTFTTVRFDGDLIDLVYSADRRGWYLLRQRDSARSTRVYPSTHEAKRALFGSAVRWEGASPKLAAHVAPRRTSAPWTCSDTSSPRGRDMDAVANLERSRRD